MKKQDRIIPAILCVLLALSIIGCGKSKSSQPEASSGPVKISYPTFRVGIHPEADNFAEIMAEFNRLYAGKYEVNIVEEVPVVDEFAQKLNMWFAAGTLPIIVDPLLEDPIFAKKLYESGLCLDLAPHINADPEWKGRLIPASLEAQTRRDGKIFSLPMPYFTIIGTFYNKTLFQKAGVNEFPKTWDAMFTALDKLNAIGVPGFMLETANNAWTAQLVLNALIGRTAEGREFMKKSIPDNYNIPAVINALADLQKLYKYSTPDSIGATTQMTTSAFLSDRIAMRPNGPWHVGAMNPPTAPEGFAKNVDVAMYPDGILIDYDSGGDNVAIINTYPPEQIEAALALCKFMSSEWYVHKQIRDLSAVSPFIALNAEDRAAMSELAIKYCELISSPDLKATVPAICVMWDGRTMNETLGKLLPALIRGTMTPEEMATELTKSAKYYIDNVG